MKNPLKSIGRWFADMARVFVREWQIVIHDQGVMVFFVLLPLMYPIVYTLIYNPEVLRKVPVVIVDQDRTAESRKLVRDASAAPIFEVYQYAADIPEAKKLVAQRDAFAILYIPDNYGKNIGRIETSHATFYMEMSLLLRYRDFFAALADVQIKDISDITAGRASILGADMASLSMPVASSANLLGDPEQGFASFVMPGIFILILQQSMVLGIAMLGGTSRERRRLNGGIDPRMVQNVSASATVWGRTFCYFTFYIAPTIYVLRWMPIIFHLPHSGDPVEYLLFMVPMLLASAFFGQTLNYFVRDRESSFMLIVVLSVVFLFLSGFTWPRYAFPRFWNAIASVVPATWGVDGFIRINSNAGTLAENHASFLWLWGLAFAYMITSVLVLRVINSRSTARR